jgi:hypothetical protein
VKHLRVGPALVPVLLLPFLVSVAGHASAADIDLPERPDEKPPEKPPTTSLFGRPLWLGGDVQARDRYKKNFDLDDATRDDTLELRHRLTLEALYVIAPKVVLFARGRAIYEPTFTLDTGERTDGKELQRREHWLFVGDILESVLGRGYSMQIGRLKFSDERRWWWRTRLDGIRLQCDRPQEHLELGATEDLAPKSTETRFIKPDEKDIFRAFGNAARIWKEKQRFDLFFLWHYDHSHRYSIGEIVPEHREDKRDGAFLWLGGRASGEVEHGTLGKLLYFVDGAWLRGKETVYDTDDFDAAHDIVSSRTTHHVSGFAFDARGTWATRAPTRPVLTIGYAFGSGDSNARRGVDTGFRQSDVANNRDRFLGIDLFRVYGEVVRPNLSNLHIFTGSLGYRVLRASSVDFVYHFYRQDVPAPFLEDAKIPDPKGESDVIGHEWDLVLALAEWEPLEIELINGAFLAGRAYGSRSGNLAEGVFLKATYSF